MRQEGQARVSDTIRERMEAAFLEIIDLCNTAPATYLASTTHEDWMELIGKLDDIAHDGMYGKDTGG